MAQATRSFLGKLELDHSHEEGSNGDAYLTNHDLLPIPGENSVWGKWTYGLFWFGECASVTSWTVAATGVKAGLSWWESWSVDREYGQNDNWDGMTDDIEESRICVIFGHALVGFFMVAVGRPGASYHLGFPTIARASFGIFGSFWPILNRDVMTVVWTGVQGVTTGNSVYVMLHAIIPQMAHIPNPFPSDVTMTGGRMVGFVIGWLLTLGCAFVQVHRFRKLIMVKSVIMVSCLFAFFIW
jgi:nucleobase:cation symporter-1, NCS1 family